MTERRQSRKDVREEDALGFVSNVEISVKPRTASSNDSGNYSGKHRLSSAVTNASSFTGSELACMSPRPHDPGQLVCVCVGGCIGGYVFVFGFVYVCA